MPLTLYGHDGSGSAAVEAALVLAGVPHHVLVAASWVPGPALAGLQAVNPLAQIPTLVWDDGTVMTESAAILIELGLRHPASGLLPTAPAARAQVLRGLVYIAANCYAMIGVIDFPARVMDQPSEAELARLQLASRAHLHQLWSVFADQFVPTAGAPFFGGTAPGALDLLASVVSRWSGSRPHLWAQRPALAALLDRVQAHALVGPVLDRHFPPAA